MSQKGAYPYDYMDCFEKFDQTELPTKQQFYGIPNDQHVTNGEYDHSRKVWKTFDIKTMGEYHYLYLKSDVLLLADVFESFRKTCLQCYKLCHYFTSPGLSWDAMLKKSIACYACEASLGKERYVKLNEWKIRKSVC